MDYNIKTTHSARTQIFLLTSPFGSSKIGIVQYICTSTYSVSIFISVFLTKNQMLNIIIIVIFIYLEKLFSNKIINESGIEIGRS